MNFPVLSPRPAEHNASAVLSLLLKELQVDVTDLTVRQTLRRHPNYPSLLSIKDAMAEWRVKSYVLQLEDAEHLRELQAPFIVHTRLRNGWFVLVRSIHNDVVTWFDTATGWHREALASFGEQWTGTVLLAEPAPDAGEVDFAGSRKTEQLARLRLAFLGWGTLLLLGGGLLTHFQAGGGLGAAWLLTKCAGTLAGIFLLIQTFDPDNQLTNRICTIGGKSGCGSVLTSPAAKLWGWLGWAEVGFVYFAGGLLAAGWSNSPLAYDLLAALAMGAFPYVAFSLYYQAYVARSWCVFCLVVQAILGAEFGLALLHGPLPLPPVTAPGAFGALWGFGLAALAYVALKPALQAAAQLGHVHKELGRLKGNPAVFRALLQQQTRRLHLPAAPLPPIVLGNPLAAHTVTLISNPLCGACAYHHKELELLLALNPNVKAELVLLVTDGPDGPSHLVARHVLALADESPGRVAAALKAWYGSAAKSYQQWAPHFPVRADLSSYDSAVERHARWCRQNGIKTTPKVYLDGLLLPRPYRLRDLATLIPRKATSREVSAV